MSYNNWIKDLTNCFTFLVYSILSILIYTHPQYKNMFAMSMTFSIMAIVFIFFNIFTYDNQSYTICKIKNIFFAISIVAFSIFFELIKEIFTEEIYDSKKRFYILLLFFVISFIITLIIRKQPLFVVPILVVFGFLRLFGSNLAGLIAFRNIAKNLPVWLLISMENSIFNIIIVLMQVFAIFIFIKNIIE